jgi:hypothetical protein
MAAATPPALAEVEAAPGALRGAPLLVATRIGEWVGSSSWWPACSRDVPP